MSDSRHHKSNGVIDMSDQPIVVWSEIQVSDLNKSIEFYNAVFGWNMAPDNSGPMPMAILGNFMGDAGGNLVEGTPAPAGSGTRIHIGVPDREAAVAKVRAAGGTIVSDPVQIPPGVYTFVQNLDGNTIGLFQANAA